MIRPEAKDQSFSLFVFRSVEHKFDNFLSFQVNTKSNTVIFSAKDQRFSFFVLRSVKHKFNLTIYLSFHLKFQMLCLFRCYICFVVITMTLKVTRKSPRQYENIHITLSRYYKTGWFSCGHALSTNQMLSSRVKLLWNVLTSVVN